VVPFASLPAFIADQASAFASSAGADASASSTSSTATSTPKAAQAVKELEISLDPADLGAMTLKLRLADGKLSITIGVANPQTLASIEDDRNLIAQRLATTASPLEDLVIQRQNPTTQETTASNATANDSSDSQGGDGDASASDGSQPRASPRRARASGGDFVV
jgi:flagellar hook-length control protein FliK